MSLDEESFIIFKIIMPNLTEYEYRLTNEMSSFSFTADLKGE